MHVQVAPLLMSARRNSLNLISAPPNMSPHHLKPVEDHVMPSCPSVQRDSSNIPNNTVPQPVGRARTPKYEEYSAFESEASCGGPLTPRSTSSMPPMAVKACDDSGREKEPIALSPRTMPMYTDEASNMNIRGSLPFAKWCADALRPYHELCEAERDGNAGKTEEVLKRLLTECDVVGRSVSFSSALCLSC